jgi:hypothetical protein
MIRPQAPKIQIFSEDFVLAPKISPSALKILLLAMKIQPVAMKISSFSSEDCPRPCRTTHGTHTSFGELNLYSAHFARLDLSNLLLPLKGEQ